MQYNTYFEEVLLEFQEGVSARDSYVKWIDYTAYERNVIFDGLYFTDRLVNEQLTVTLDVLRGNEDVFIQKKLLPLLITERYFNEAEALLNEIMEKEGETLYSLEQTASLYLNRDQISFSSLPVVLQNDLTAYWVSNPYASMQSALQANNQSSNFFVLPALIALTTENNKWDGNAKQTKSNEVSQNTLLCYPNPTQFNSGNIKGSLVQMEEGHSELIIYNSLGQTIQSKLIENTEFEFQITLPSKGLYLVVIMQNGIVIQQQKWVVQ
ncbi:MAG: hypothetical protein ACI85Q_002855 [Salibacteraceae bacterium]|jgi:hypothetical protein